jgi:hypothetical protein
MRELLVKLRVRRIAGQEGWVMMDAVWSSVVVVLAFMATFMALENGNKTATRDIARTTAYDLAQDELAGLHDLGRQSLTALVAKNNLASPPTSPSKTVTLNGHQYKIWYSAYYVTGLGNNATDACGGTYASNGSGTAKFVYIKVTVVYDGITFAGATPSRSLPTLDEYFAPEGADSTGTLRVYLLKPPTDTAWGGVTVNLVATGPGMNFPPQSQTTGTTSGCVLFTGLPRGQYNIAVVTSKYDIYLNNATGSQLNVPINLPDRSSVSKEIRMDSPVKVPFDFWVHGIKDNADVEAVPPTTNTSSGVGASSLVGPWTARSSKILAIPTNHPAPGEYSLSPGTSYMPHGTWLPSYGAKYLYPEPNGYDTFAGACDVNESSTTTSVPATGNPTFTAGGTYQVASADPIFWLDQLDLKVATTPLTDQTGGPGATGLNNWKLKEIKKFSSTGPYGAKVQVKLINKEGTSPLGTAATAASCGVHPELFNTWLRLKGNMYSQPLAAAPYNVPMPRLEDPATAIPAGQYNVCVDAYVTGSQWRRTNAITPATYGWVAVAEHRYKSFVYDTSSTTPVTWDPFNDLPVVNADCSTSSALWSP